MPLVALAYHDVAPRSDWALTGFQGAGPDRYKVEPDRFASQLEALAEAELEPGLAGASPLILTFDDGGAAAATTAGPMLAARGWPGYFFVVSGRIGAPGFLDAPAVRELAAAGHVIGSHSRTHPIMTRLDGASLDDEWRRSKAELEDVLGAEVDTASVPRGYVTRRVLESAAGAGYRHVFTSEPWLEPRAVGGATVYGRFAVTRETPPARVAALARAERRAVWPVAAGWHARKAAKRAAGPAYERLRAALLSRRARA